MERFQVTVGTVIDNLSRFMAAGNSLRAGADLREVVKASTTQQQAVFAAFDEVGTLRLKPVFDQLNGEVNYDDLKVLRLIYEIGGEG
jgi:ATP-dependent DNA helicase RecQ